MKRARVPTPPKINYARRLSVLCVDPGFRNLGWGVVCMEYGAPYIAAMGVVRTKPSAKKMRILKSDDNARSIQELSRALLAVIREYEIDAIAYESFSMPQAASKTAAVKIGLPYGILGALSECTGVPTFQATPQRVKTVLCGVANASKDLVESEVKVRLSCQASRRAIDQFRETHPASAWNHAWDALGCYFALEGSDVFTALKRGYGRAV